MRLPQPWYLKGEIFSVECLFLWLGRGAGAGGQRCEKGKRIQEDEFGVTLNPVLHLLGPARLPRLALPGGSSGQDSPFFRKFSSSVRRSLPGQAQIRTSKLFRPSRFPLPGVRRGKTQDCEKAGPILSISKQPAPQPQGHPEATDR